jgi:hypothetical protein
MSTAEGDRSLDGVLLVGDKILMKQHSRRRKPLVAWYVMPLALAVVALAVAALSPAPAVPPMDDTYIHLVFGHSLLSSSPLSFNPGEPSSGFTSPLWLLPSAAASLVGTGGAPLLLMLFSTICAALAIAAVESRTSLLLALTGPFLFHATSGMETAAACLMIVLAWKSVRDDSLHGWRPWLLAAAFLCRPELALLAVPFLMVTWRRGWKAVALLLLPSLATGCLWILWNLHATGLPLPSTFYAKSTGWTAIAAAGIIGLLRSIALTSIMLPFAAAVAVAALIRGDITRDRVTGLALASFPVLLVAAALATQPNSWFQMRYFLPPLIAMLLASGHWLSKIPRWRSNLAILAVSLIPGLLIFAGRRMDASPDVNAIDVSPASWLAEHVQPGATVASGDIGAMGWISGLRVLDLDGLVTPERLPGGIGTGWEWVSARADYLAAFPGQYADLIRDGSGTLEYLVGFNSPKNVICGEDSVAVWRVMDTEPSGVPAGTPAR